MTLETQDQPAAVDTAAESTPTVPDTTVAEPTEPTELEGLLNEEQADPDEIEEEFEGLKLRGKKDHLEEFKKGRMLHADYTRKTQEFAEQRKSWESERTATEQLEQEKYQFWSLQQRAQQLQQVNFQALRQANPEMAENLRDELAKLSAALPVMGQALAQKTQERKLEAERANANRVNQSELIVAREVKDWGPAKLQAFMDAGQKAGLDSRAVRDMLVQFPQAARFLNKSLAYDQMLAQRLQKAKTPPPAPKPVTRVGGSSASTTKSTSDMTPAEYAEWRRARQKR